MPPPFPATSSRRGNWLRHKIKKEEEEEEVLKEENLEEEEEEDYDPQYRFFLDHLTPDASGTSYVLHIEPIIHLRYEAATATAAAAAAADDDVDESPLKCSNVVNNNKKGKKDDELQRKKEKIIKNKIMKKKKKKKKKVTNDEMLSSLSPSTSDSCQINLDPLDPSVVDRDYHNFLRSLKPQRDGSLLLHLDNNVTIRYAKEEEEEEEEEEKDEEYDDDDDKELLTKIKEDYEYQKEIIAKIKEEEGDDCEQESYSPPPPPPRNASGRQEQVPVSAFHTRLLNLINRPYDQREYHDLFKSATVRKPVIKYKYLKTRDVPYETAKLGSSYFDHYPDLHGKFKSAGRCQRLMLLRGFFFWLKNLEHEGAYKPWISTP